MHAGKKRLLYVDGYTMPSPKHGVPSSDAIGYGITASKPIREGLRAAGFDVHCPPPPVHTGRGSGADRLAYIISAYDDALTAMVEDPPEAVFLFHIFTTFPAEIRRMALDLGLSVPIVGYTHGSHWDPTDTFRHEFYPRMKLLDLANLYVMDRILLVSEYMRRTLLTNIGAFDSELARSVDAKAVVVGLPLDVERIDACRTGQRLRRTTVVFNHAPVSSKHPELFVQVMGRVLPDYEIDVLFTRDFPAAHPGGASVAALAERFPEQVVLGRDLPLDEYYRLLWSTDLHVSTATHESLGVATLEAMYTGNCCILPMLGSYPEICDGHPDVLYEWGSGALEERLRFFLDNPGRRSAVASELQTKAIRYHPKSVVADVIRPLLEMIEEGRSGSC